MHLRSSWCITGMVHAEYVSKLLAVFIRHPCHLATCKLHCSSVVKRFGIELRWSPVSSLTCAWHIADVWNAAGLTILLLVLYAGELLHIGVCLQHHNVLRTPVDMLQLADIQFIAGLYLCIGDPFLPGSQGSAWAILVVWIGGHVGAFLAELVGTVDVSIRDMV
jgi:hypothetical protein